MRGLLALASLGLAGCTLIAAQGFQECAKDSDCVKPGLCLESYCIRPPEGCERSLGAVDHPRRIPLAAALPITEGGTLDGGIDESEIQDLNAAVLALEEVNQRDGVGGRPFALYVCNTGGSKQRIQEQALWLAEQLKAPALITSGSGQTIAAHTVTVPRGVLIISATATSPELTSLLDSSGGSVGLVWRTAPSDAIQGKVIADLLINGCTAAEGCQPAITPVTKVGVVYVDDPYGQGLKEVLAARFGQAPREIRSFQFTRGGDVGPAVNGLAAFGPQVTVVIGFPSDVSNIVTLAQAKPNLTKAQGHRWFLTDSAKDPATVSGSPSGALDGAFGTAPAQGAGGGFSSFRDRFLAKYAVNPLDFSYTSHSYDAMYVLALGAAYAAGADGNLPITGARMAEGLTKLSAGALSPLTPDQFTPAKSSLQKGTSIDIEGASGKLNFDPATGEAPSAIELWQVKPSGTGAFSTVRTIAAPEG